MSYTGYDYGELLKVVVPDFALGILDEDEAIESLCININYRFDIAEAEYSEEGQLIILEMRDFLGALIHNSDTLVPELPVWKALATVAESFTFVKMFLSLITTMWS